MITFNCFDFVVFKFVLLQTSYQQLIDSADTLAHIHTSQLKHTQKMSLFQDLKLKRRKTSSTVVQLGIPSNHALNEGGGGNGNAITASRLSCLLAKKGSISRVSQPLIAERQTPTETENGDSCEALAVAEIVERSENNSATAAAGLLLHLSSGGSRPTLSHTPLAVLNEKAGLSCVQKTSVVNLISNNPGGNCVRVIQTSGSNFRSNSFSSGSCSGSSTASTGSSASSTSSIFEMDAEQCLDLSTRCKARALLANRRGTVPVVVGLNWANRNGSAKSSVMGPPSSDSSETLDSPSVLVIQPPLLSTAKPISPPTADSTSSQANFSVTNLMLNNCLSKPTTVIDYVGSSATDPDAAVASRALLQLSAVGSSTTPPSTEQPRSQPQSLPQMNAESYSPSVSCSPPQLMNTSSLAKNSQERRSRPSSPADSQNDLNLANPLSFSLASLRRESPISESGRASTFSSDQNSCQPFNQIQLSGAPSPPPRPPSNDQMMICMICEDKATGLHYGIITCEGCKGFFKRTVQNKRVYSCVADCQCVITKQQRNRCQYCRFQKCLRKGMVLAAVREDRMPGGRNSGAVYNLYKVKYKKHKKNNAPGNGQNMLETSGTGEPSPAPTSSAIVSSTTPVNSLNANGAVTYRILTTNTNSTAVGSTGGGATIFSFTPRDANAAQMTETNGRTVSSGFLAALIANQSSQADQNAGQSMDESMRESATSDASSKTQVKTGNERANEPKIMMGILKSALIGSKVTSSSGLHRSSITAQPILSRALNEPRQVVAWFTRCEPKQPATETVANASSASAVEQNEMETDRQEPHEMVAKLVEADDCSELDAGNLTKSGGRRTDDEDDMMNIILDRKLTLNEKLCSIGDSIVNRLVQWTKRLPFYEKLPVQSITTVRHFFYRSADCKKRLACSVNIVQG